MSAAAALVAAAALAGCGSTTYFAGRTLPPSGIANRVMIAVQNPSPYTKGELEIVDAYYDIRSSYNSKTGSFSIAGFGGGLPVTIQNMPEEQMGAVYGSADGSLTFANYANEATNGTAQGLGTPHFLKHLHHPQRAVGFCRQPGKPLPYRGQPGHWFVL